MAAMHIYPNILPMCANGKNQEKDFPFCSDLMFLSPPPSFDTAKLYERHCIGFPPLSQNVCDLFYKNSKWDSNMSFCLRPFVPERLLWHLPAGNSLIKFFNEDNKWWQISKCMKRDALCPSPSQVCCSLWWKWSSLLLLLNSSDTSCQCCGIPQGNDVRVSFIFMEACHTHTHTHARTLLCSSH